jgi:hypothetical protein
MYLQLMTIKQENANADMQRREQVMAVGGLLGALAASG